MSAAAPPPGSDAHGSGEHASEALKPTVLPAGTPLPKRPTASTVLPTDGTPAPRPRRTRKGWDIGVSILLLILSYIAFSVCAVFALLAVAFFTGCNEHGCGTGDAPYLAAYTLAALVVVGTIATIVAIVLRFRGWPIAVITFGTVLIGWFIVFAISAAGS